MRTDHGGTTALLQLLRAELRRETLPQESREPSECRGVLPVRQSGVLDAAATGFRLVANPGIPGASLPRHLPGLWLSCSSRGSAS
jgi:hypothetical protein